MAAGTNLSRILGFIRDMVIAFFFGTSGLLEVFLVAFRLPNVFRSLLGEEAVDAVVIPVISEHKNDDYFKLLTRRLLFFVFCALSAIVVIGIIMAPLIVRIVAPGFVSDPQKFLFTVVATRIVFSYLLFIGLSAQLAGVLFVKNNYIVPSFSPAILNIVLILGVWLSAHAKFNQVYLLCWFVILAGIIQFSFHFVFTKKYIASKEPLSRAFKDKNITRMVKLFIPRIWSVAVYHINILVIDTLLASFSGIVGAGAIATIYFANRFVQFPLSTVGLSISRAALPELSSLSHEEDLNNFRQTLYFSLKTIFALIVPVIFLYLFYGETFIKIFKSGRFDTYSLAVTTNVLFYYSLGLLFYAVSRIFIICFYALKDTKTPAKSATVALIVNIVLSIILMYPLKVCGLALASSIAAFVNSIILFVVLRRRIGSFIKGLWLELTKCILASFFMVSALYCLNGVISQANRFLSLFLLLLFAFIFYSIIACFFRISFFKDSLDHMCLRFKGGHGD